MSPIRRRKGAVKRPKRKLKWLLLFVAVIIVVLFFFLPTIISSRGGQKLILARINKSIAGTTKFTDFSVSWHKGLELDDLSFNDDAGNVSVSVKRITTRPRYLPLLAGSISLGSTVIDQPRVNVKIKDSAVKSSDTPGKSTKSPRSANIALPLKKVDLVINDGSFKVDVESPGSLVRSVELKNINSKLNFQGLGKTTT